MREECRICGEVILPKDGLEDRFGVRVSFHAQCLHGIENKIVQIMDDGASGMMALHEDGRLSRLSFEAHGSPPKYSCRPIMYTMVNVHGDATFTPLLDAAKDVIAHFQDNDDPKDWPACIQELAGAVEDAPR